MKKDGVPGELVPPRGIAGPPRTEAQVAIHAIGQILSGPISGDRVPFCMDVPRLSSRLVAGGGPIG